MKPSAILRKAARQLEREPACGLFYGSAQFRRSGCCEAIVRQGGGRHYYFCMKYFMCVAPRGAKAGEYWFGLPYESINQNRRILALCFAAAIAESEGQ